MDVMIVDSDCQTSQSIAAYVQKWGHRTTTVSTVQQATSIADHRMYDLVFLDAHLSDTDGLKLIPRLKRAWPQTRIVLISGSPSRALELEALQHGVIYYMPKPIDVTRVKAIVDFVDQKFAGKNPKP